MAGQESLGRGVASLGQKRGSSAKHEGLWSGGTWASLGKAVPGVACGAGGGGSASCQLVSESGRWAWGPDALQADAL